MTRADLIKKQAKKVNELTEKIKKLPSQKDREELYKKLLDVVNDNLNELNDFDKGKR